jgi:ubiquinone/menaquinone biosynthesis C-methylase UbiE
MIPGFFQGTEMPTEGWWDTLWPDPARVLTSLGLKPGMGVVDLCCGDGWFTLPMAQVASHVVAIDIDQKLLDMARARLATVTNCEFVEADAFDIAKVVKRPAEFVFLANVFHGVPDRPRLAAAVKDVLQPDGLFVIVNWHSRSREETPVLGQPRGPKTELRIGPETTKADVEAGGLKLASVVELSSYHYGAVFQKPPQSK